MCALVSWSGGKDCYTALVRCLGRDPRSVRGLLTRLVLPLGRSQMHGVSRRVLEAQAEALSLPLYYVEIPAPEGTPSDSRTAFAPNEVYKRQMNSTLRSLSRTHRAPPAGDGDDVLLFGDIDPPEIAAWQRDALAPSQHELSFPLMGRSTKSVALEFLATGAESIVVCVDTNSLGTEALGRRYDRDFVAGLPAGVDPAGEGGEFHTFVVDGPHFRHRVPVRVVPGSVFVSGHFAWIDLELQCDQKAAPGTGCH
eukprot:m51a1_g588 hypothetical protein (253) ;mRNA; r:18095-19213